MTWSPTVSPWTLHAVLPGNNFCTSSLEAPPTTCKHKGLINTSIAQGSFYTSKTEYVHNIIHKHPGIHQVIVQLPSHCLAVRRYGTYHHKIRMWWSLPNAHTVYSPSELEWVQSLCLLWGWWRLWLREGSCCQTSCAAEAPHYAEWSDEYSHNCRVLPRTALL